ncbi:MAG: hypothetical protein L3J98_06115 [Gammaproteobacteria bacterium]|nr:hypothetical protein [Gammaproteobacteria bacterium]MCF6259721.1 hypothetical protein [Gammaproteobacteria bacterium]
MFFHKKYISYALYVLSLIITTSTGIYVILVSKKFILAGEGIGIYGVLIYHSAAFISVILWGLSYWLFHNKKLTVIFWLIFLIFTIFITLQPTWWAAPPISS